MHAALLIYHSSIYLIEYNNKQTKIKERKKEIDIYLPHF